MARPPSARGRAARRRTASSARVTPGAGPTVELGIFAEGSDPTDPSRDRFRELWAEQLCGRLGVLPEKVRIYPFFKLQIELLGDPVGVQQRSVGSTREPLDLLIRRSHERDGFWTAVIAFDRTPPNKSLKEPCLRTEVDFVLQGIVKRGLLSGLPFHDEAERLLEHYRLNRGVPRGPGRPPRGCLDLLYMDPEFEGLFVGDETTVLHALGHDRRPKDWPTFDPDALYPARDVLGKAVRLAARDVKAKVRGNMETNKHGWAGWILKHAADDARLFQHPIVDRLRTILA